MYLHTSLDQFVSWLRAAMHHWTTSFASTSWLVEGFIWYLQSAHFMHAPAPSCSYFPWLVSKKFQQCLMQVFLWRQHNQKNACRFELTCASVWPYPIFIECCSTIFQGIINFSKTMLCKICIMCTIVTDIKVIFFNDISIFTRDLYMIHVLFRMSI